MSRSEDVSDESLETYSFVYGDVHISYFVKREKITPGKIRKVRISVPPNARVVVAAPEEAQRAEIHDAVMKRAKWIYDNLRKFEQQQVHAQTRHYVSGEMQFYLGRRYVLKVVETDTEARAHVKMERGQLRVQLPSNQARSQQDRADLVKELLRHWYRMRAQHVFATRLDALLPKTRWVRSAPDFRILAMEKQWGSCSARGALMLNPHLVKAPRECIDYVILHELCHIAEHNHSERFYRLLTQVMPEWRQFKRQLDGMAEEVLTE